MITSASMHQQVETALQEHADNFDIPGIVADLIAHHGRVDVGTIDPGPFWAAVARWAACDCGRAHAAAEWACESSGADLVLGRRGA